MRRGRTASARRPRQSRQPDDAAPDHVRATAPGATRDRAPELITAGGSPRSSSAAEGGLGCWTLQPHDDIPENPGRHAARCRGSAGIDGELRRFAAEDATVQLLGLPRSELGVGVGQRGTPSDHPNSAQRPSAYARSSFMITIMSVNGDQDPLARSGLAVIEVGVRRLDGVLADPVLIQPVRRLEQGDCRAHGSVVDAALGERGAGGADRVQSLLRLGDVRSGVAGRTQLWAPSPLATDTRWSAVRGDGTGSRTRVVTAALPADLWSSAMSAVSAVGRVRVGPGYSPGW